MLSISDVPCLSTVILRSSSPAEMVTLSDATSGGSWSTSDTSVATVDGSGDVTGVSAGNATITYTIGTSCYITSIVTVNSNPAAITGITNVCIGLSTTLADVTAGGSWSASTGAVSVGTSTGVITGVSAGTPIPAGR